MMQDRWPPEPPRHEPQRQGRANNTAVVVLLALLCFMIAAAVVGWRLMETPSLGRSEGGAGDAVTRVAGRIGAVVVRAGMDDNRRPVLIHQRVLAAL